MHKLKPKSNSVFILYAVIYNIGSIMLVRDMLVGDPSSQLGYGFIIFSYTVFGLLLQLLLHLAFSNTFSDNTKFLLGVGSSPAIPLLEMFLLPVLIT